MNGAYNHGKKQDRLIMSRLLGAMSEEIISDLLHCNITKEIWQHLHQMFASRDLANVMELKTKLQNARKGNLSLKEYMRQLKNLIDSLKGAGKLISLEDHILHI